MRLDVASTPVAYTDEPRVCLFVDGERLDLWFARRGLPSVADTAHTLGGELDDAHDLAAVWDAVLPADGATSLLPVLTCPDDVDLCCETLVVEVARDGQRVVWTPVGWGRGDGFPAKVDAEGFPTVPSLTFALPDYRRALDTLRRLAPPQARLPEGHDGFRVGQRWTVTDTLGLRGRRPHAWGLASRGTVLRVIEVFDASPAPWGWAVVEAGEIDGADGPWPVDARAFVGPEALRHLTAVTAEV